MCKADDLNLQRSSGSHILPLVHKSAALMLMSANFPHNNSFLSFYFTFLKRAAANSHLFACSSYSDISYSAKSLVRKSRRSWSD